MTAKVLNPANFIVCKIDHNGYPRFACNEFFTKDKADEIAATMKPGLIIEVMTFTEYKARQDPDSMGEREQAKRFGGKVDTPKKIAITGAIAGHTRASAAEAAKKAGYTVVETITAGLAFVWAGDKAGSKASKARALGIPVVSVLA